MERPAWALAARRVQLWLSGCTVVAFQGGEMVGELCVRLDSHPSNWESGMVTGGMYEWGAMLAAAGILLGIVLMFIPNCGERFRIPIYGAFLACILAVVFFPLRLNR